MFIPFLFPTTGEEWRHWLANDLPPVAIVIGVLFIVQWAFRALVGRLIRRVVRRAAEVRGGDPAAAERRTQTVTAVADWTVTTLVFFIGLAIVLDAFGLNVSALVASAGIIGIGLSFGAQTLVRDLINGTFILAENQYGVGDVVSVGGVSGAVIDVNPRRTVLRDMNGHVHTVPNGQITVTTNMTRDFARINLDISVAYEEDMDRIVEVVDDVCAALADERKEDFILTPKVLRVEQLADSGVVVKVTGDVRPFAQWELTGELRRRIHRRFVEEGIEIPYPHRVTLVKGADGAKE